VRQFLLITALLATVAWFPAVTASADNGPHTGAFTATTDACAGCHRAHRGEARRLLKQATQQALCFSCHGTNATGADTNVEDGVYLERDPHVESPAEGIANRGLRGGGFEYALMDTDWDGSATGAQVTSKHNVGESNLTIWGNGAIGSGPGRTGVTLQCGSCHNPHGFSDTDRYRVLRPIPSDSGASDGVDVPDQDPKVYTVSDTDKKSGNQYFGEDYGDLADPLSDWCAQCHTRYLAPQGSGHTDSGDPIFAYRHITDGSPGCNLCHGGGHGGVVASGGPLFNHKVRCLTCHVAHGSSATMGQYSGAVEWPDGALGNGSGDSRLLRVDNRGVCYLCHGNP